MKEGVDFFAWDCVMMVLGLVLMVVAIGANGENRYGREDVNDGKDVKLKVSRDHDFIGSDAKNTTNQ